MGVNSLPKTVTRQRRGCDFNPGPSVPKSSMLNTRLPSHPLKQCLLNNNNNNNNVQGPRLICDAAGVDVVMYSSALQLVHSRQPAVCHGRLSHHRVAQWVSTWSRQTSCKSCIQHSLGGIFDVWAMSGWCGYLSGARCRLFAYGPAGATASPKPRRLLPDLNPDWFYLSGTSIPRLSWIRGR